MTKRKPGAVKGRPRKWRITEVSEEVFKHSHTETVIQLMANGYLDQQIMAVLNISSMTWHRWKKDNEEFSKAIEVGKPKRFHWWMTEGRKRYEAGHEKGHKFWQGAIRHLCTDLGMTWDNETSQTKLGTQININNMQVVQKDQNELLESIKANFNQLYPNTQVELIDASPEIKTIINESGQIKST